MFVKGWWMGYSIESSWMENLLCEADAESVGLGSIDVDEHSLCGIEWYKD